ncbi:hypothetical protein [Nocardioides stalactiti]|uniref:hypothetical protein n=1 Tax=Nocardioides stalactiti TaxID=2755356 RepID=UPI001602FBEC|nr:hypothetical protein [Nocardioides stalactiti]
MTEDEQVDRFVHRVLHLRARKGTLAFSEACLVADCWGEPLDSAPQWAVDLANVGEPGARWCPRISPNLNRSEP